VLHSGRHFLANIRLGWKSLLRDSRLFGGFANNECRKSYKIGAWAEENILHNAHITTV